MKKPFIKLLIIIAISSAGFIFYNNYYLPTTQSSPSLVQPPEENTAPKDRIEKILITDGSTYGSLMATSGIEYATSQAIYAAAQEIYDLVKIRAGRELVLLYDAINDELKEFSYKIDSEEELIISKLTDNNYGTSTDNAASSTWQAIIKDIPYQVGIKSAQGTVETSMYEAAIENDIDIRAIIELANAFQWTIDFAMDPRVGDTFRFIYEERYLDGEYVMPGRVLAGRYINDGEQYDVYYFEESADNAGFFDADGNSVQKMFLKAPVSFKYISSNFTTGPRYIAEFQRFTSSHMAIDYAAANGSPVRSVGDGTIIYAGWNSQGYGNYISIRHNGTYTTNYAHLSKIYVSYGQKVKQSEIVGAVGSTGFSTGPHLHYEMVKNGSKVNPLREVLPPGKPIKEENQERFFAEIKKWQEELNK